MKMMERAILDICTVDRRSVLFGLSAIAAPLALKGTAAAASTLATSDTGPTLLINGRIRPSARNRTEAQALVVRNGLVEAIGSNVAMRTRAGPDATTIDLGGRRVIPGLNDSHLHVTRGGRFYALETRWEGVNTLSRALQMIAAQARRTPQGQWVRVIGGWSPHQFAERRVPTIAELNEAAPDTPVFVLQLYSRGFLNRAGVRALGITSSTRPPVPGSRYELLDNGGAILHAEPHPAILYRTVDALPQLSAAQQERSALYFIAELNRFGLTSAIDAGGGGHLYPRDYAASAQLASSGRLNLRIANFLFAQTPGDELSAYRRWTETERLNLNRASELLEGYLVEGAGESIVASAVDFENFIAAPPVLSPAVNRELTDVVRVLAQARWPIRIHATYDGTISRILDVFEPVFEQTRYRARWVIDHAETISDHNIERIKRLGGAVAIQNRMAFAGEEFVERYGRSVARRTPPLRKLFDSGLPLGAGTDGTRVSSYNPWASLAWMVTGRTVGGTQLYPANNCLTRAEALHLYTHGSAWFSGEEDRKGRLMPGQFADLAVLDRDYFAVAEDELGTLSADLAMVGGRVVHGAGAFAALAPSLPPILPDWSPVTLSPTPD
jgi:hypothetical protein